MCVYIYVCVCVCVCVFRVQRTQFAWHGGARWTKGPVLCACVRVCVCVSTQVYAFLSPARAVVGGVVREKELRLREGMRLMGERD